MVGTWKEINLDTLATDTLRAIRDDLQAKDPAERLAHLDTLCTLGELIKEREQAGAAPAKIRPWRATLCPGKAAILTVHASSYQEARLRVREQLNRPGRYEILDQWKAAGRHLEEVQD